MYCKKSADKDIIFNSSPAGTPLKLDNLVPLFVFLYDIF